MGSCRAKKNFRKARRAMRGYGDDPKETYKSTCSRCVYCSKLDVVESGCFNTMKVQQMRLDADKAEVFYFENKDIWFCSLLCLMMFEQDSGVRNNFNYTDYKSHRSDFYKHLEPPEPVEVSQ